MATNLSVRWQTVARARLPHTHFDIANDVTDPRNNLLDVLPRKERANLLGVSEFVGLEAGQVLGQFGAPLGHVYFPKDSAFSLLASIDGHDGLEVGVVGCEGMLGAHVALDVVTSAVRTQVVKPGDAWRIELQAFRDALERLPTLRRCLNAYLSVLMTQLTMTAGCFCFHEIGPRLARRILIAQDLAQAERLPLTQDSLAHLLGVRRSSVSIAASALRLKGLIDYRRGELAVLKRKGLEAVACSCYAAFGRASRDGFQR